MFQVEIMQGIGKPVQVLSATQVVIRTPNGTPVSLAAMFGGSSGIMVSHCNDPEFTANLRKVGIADTVITEKVNV
jgi:hypothetical protein